MSSRCAEQLKRKDETRIRFQSKASVLITKNCYRNPIVYTNLVLNLSPRTRAMSLVRTTKITTVKVRHALTGIAEQTSFFDKQKALLLGELPNMFNNHYNTP